MRISVCIPTTRPDTLGAAVRSIIRQTFDDWELFVVGQGDEQVLRDKTAEAAGGDARVSYVHLEGRGASLARNAGFTHGTGDLFAFIDDDCEAASDWLERVDEAFEPGIALVAGSLVAPTPERRFLAVCPQIEPEDVTHDAGTSGDEPPPGFGLLGANMVVSREAMDLVGRFDEYLGPGAPFGGGEEHDYAVRLLRAGATVSSTRRSIVYHTYGYRYGLRAVLSHRRDRIRGDGALAGKQTLLDATADKRSTGELVREFAKVQFRTITLRRLPNGLMRVFHYTKSYRECLRNYVVDRSEPARAVLVQRPPGDVDVP